MCGTFPPGPRSQGHQRVIPARSVIRSFSPFRPKNTIRFARAGDRYSYPYVKTTISIFKDTLKNSFPCPRALFLQIDSQRPISPYHLIRAYSSVCRYIAAGIGNPHVCRIVAHDVVRSLYRRCRQFLRNSCRSAVSPGLTCATDAAQIITKTAKVQASGLKGTTCFMNCPA